MRVAVNTIWLDDKTMMFLRSNGTFVVRKLTGGSHEGALYGRQIVHGHVIARGRVTGPNSLRLSRGDLTVPQLRALIKNVPGYEHVAVKR